MEGKIFTKNGEEQIEIKKRNAYRKILLKELYVRMFKDKEMNKSVTFKGKSDSEDFEKFLAYKVLNELGYVNLVYDEKRIVPEEGYAVEITPKGILYYENL
ncbi:hypothetical protein ABC382_19195 [Lysinibacillus sp. 1P01SD]|uniref:hypothetical protein n=1 Tax=Lysinibacillus sp. 1P01SD TaxID=3132285 RepID=UPI0039A358D1